MFGRSCNFHLNSQIKNPTLSSPPEIHFRIIAEMSREDLITSNIDMSQKYTLFRKHKTDTNQKEYNTTSTQCNKLNKSRKILEGEIERLKSKGTR